MGKSVTSSFGARDETKVGFYCWGVVLLRYL